MRLKKNKTPVWIYASYTPIKNESGEVFKVFKIASDVTESVKTRMQLKVLLDKINDLSSSVTRSSKEVSERAQNMKASTFEMSSAMTQMAQGAQDQAKQVDEISNRLNDVLESAKNTAQRALTIKKTADAGVSSAKNGQRTINFMAESMRKIQKNTLTTMGAIDELIHGSNEISKAVNVISEISARTNLLALNAAIEAAKAGDYGNGFAVVADEIRKLAEGTKNHAQEISSVIEKVQTSIEQAVGSINEMDKSVKEGEHSSIDAQKALETLAENTSDTLNKSGEIEETAAFQRESVKDTVSSVEKIVVVTEETARGTEQITNSAQTIRKGMDDIANESQNLRLVSEQLLRIVKETRA